MPRRPGRPAPSYLWEILSGRTRPARLSGPHPPPPPAFFLVATMGLLRRLERIEGKDQAWLRDQLVIMGGAFARVVREHGMAAVCQALASWIASTPTPRRNASRCWPLQLLRHYDLAAEILGPANASRPRSLDVRASGIRRAAQLLYAELATPEYRCTCACRTTLPPGFEGWVSVRRTTRELILYLLAHHHGTTPESLRHQLDAATRQLPPSLR